MNTATPSIRIMHTYLHMAQPEFIIQVELIALVDVVPGETAALLRLHIMPDLYIVHPEGVVCPIHSADPVVTPPVAKEWREQIPKDL